MDIRKKENHGMNLTFKLSYKQYKNFINKIKELGKEFEYNSDVNKLDYSLLVNCQKLPFMKIKGWSSRIAGSNKHVTFVDYDNILWDLVLDEISYISKKFNLPPWIVLTTFEEEDSNGQTYGNYLLINLKKCTFNEVISIQNELSCDQAFKKIPLLYRFKCWCMRLGEKNDGKKIKRPSPKFKCIIGDTKESYPQEVSEGHLKVINSIYPESKGLVNYLNKDGGDISKVTFVDYVTASG